MISAFENMARSCPHRVCFTFVDKTGAVSVFSYRDVRLGAAALARHLADAGVRRGDCVSVDLPNCPAFVFLVLAAAYGGFSLIVLNQRLTVSEKMSRLLEVQRHHSVRVAMRIDEARADRLLSRARAAAAAEGESLLHFADRRGHVFDPEARALVMFTSGSTGACKAVPLTWENLVASAKASNDALNNPGSGVWQAVLPLYHIGGFQVVVRSLCNKSPFVLYRRFDPERVLRDAATYRATHVSVVDKMLQDLLAATERDAGIPGKPLARYECILLGGGALNPRTIGRALAAGARVFASYGMTETSSQIASLPITVASDGGMRLLRGYEARIIAPDQAGYGRLAVKGPGVFAGYLNAKAPQTLDGYFVTGDTAALRGNVLYVKERTADMFVSGGENVYPGEIASKLLQVPGVSDAYVFGAPDETWGRRPVAFIEKDKAVDVPASLFARGVLQRVRPCMSKVYVPKHVFGVDAFPRTAIGKTDRAVLEDCYRERIEIDRVILHCATLPFANVQRTAKVELHERETLLVEVVDFRGRTGIGECTSFSTDWYLPETIGQDAAVLRDVLVPMVLGDAYLHPSEAAAAFEACGEAAAFPSARAALESALWDLYGKIVQEPLWSLIGGRPDGAGCAADGASAAGGVLVGAGAIIGLGGVEETLEAARRCVAVGYKRIKLKVAPGRMLQRVRAVRREFPDIAITLDANQSFSDDDVAELCELDGLNIAWIEEPLKPQGRHRGAAGLGASAGLPGAGAGASGAVGTSAASALGAGARPGASGAGAGAKAGTGAAMFARLSQLQRRIATPICLDESFTCKEQAEEALRYEGLRCFAVKVGKFGGVQATLDFIEKAAACGAVLWMGGMYDTGVSKALHAAFQTLPEVSGAGDIGSVTRMFPADVADPPHVANHGLVQLNRSGHSYGVGCSLNRAALASLGATSVTFRRG